MWDATAEIMIARSLERIWTIITDVPRHTELAGSREVRSISLDQPLSVGVEWEADIGVPEVGEPFKSVSKVLVLDEPSEFRWSSIPLVRANRDEVPIVTWWFRLEARDATHVEHGCHVDAPRIGAEAFRTFFFETATRPPTILEGMRRTLQNLKGRAEAASIPASM